MARVALIGECMIELQQRADGSLGQSFGGDTLNTAVYLRRLLPPQWQVSYVTALGDDSFSDAMCASWQEEGIDLSLVQRLPGRLPGIYCIQTDAQGERRFLYWRNEAAVRDCFSQPGAAVVLEQLPQYSVIYLSGISLAVLGEEGLGKLLPCLAEARRSGTQVVFDNNYRPRLWRDHRHALATYQRLLPMVDIALLTLDDEQLLFQETSVSETLARYRGYGVPHVVLKRGAQSCLLVEGGRQLEVAAQEVAKVVDTTAAGDSFSAGYLAAWLQGSPAETSASLAHRLAARVIQYPGALIPAAAMP
ncbi:2-dehydro-3-deoxygluconokinase [Pseudomonas flavescens]|uniref:2-dehydro-3-deoxygluconokinase n=1 Tax=Phytopseudomonas flavescens TaxID=29435 RepID=A0A1G8KFQ3_9GAMM|nr:sugar kinase [Pseudomonas flavescens]SDI42236.1 2-dehydro-3-deoxygluconokinase [Pseudomonas flavescens]